MKQEQRHVVFFHLEIGKVPVMKTIIATAIVALGLVAGIAGAASAAMTDQDRQTVFEPKGGAGLTDTDRQEIFTPKGE